MKTLLAIRSLTGVLSLTCLALLALSGWGLMAGYVPSDAEAFDSVLYARQAGELGGFVRALHHHASFGLVVTGFLCLLTSFLSGRHTGSQETRLSWWLGVTCYLLVLGICFTGFLLPMDQNAYWGSIVRLGIVEAAPLVGPPAADLLRGGAVLNASTLPRFYALHVSVLPFLGFLLLLPLIGSARPEGLGRGALAAAVAGLAALYAVSAVVPAPLELPADPTDTDYIPRPEWYFLWLFQLGKYLESAAWVRSLLLPVAGLGLLYALPRFGGLAAKQRTALAGGWCLAWSALTALALYEDRELAPRLSYEEATVKAAAQSYGVHCRECHGDEGRGDGAESRAWDLDTPDFTLEEFWENSSRDEMIDAIANGLGEDMPAFKKQLSAAEIESLFDYIETTFRHPSTL